MKDAAKQGRAQPSQIVVDALAAQTVNVRTAVGDLESVKRDLRRQKRGEKPIAPASLADIQLTEEWTTTGYPEFRPFMMYDSGSQAADRVIIYATDEALAHLSTSREWFMDGTFGTAPQLFTQLYVIRAPAGASSVTCVYAFLTGKSRALYEEMFRALNDHCRTKGFELDPETVKVDFEQAVFQAIEGVYGNTVTVSGCYYHLTQSTYRKVQELGLANQYSTDAAVHHFCGMIDGLAFLPVNDVPDGMALLRSLIPTLPHLEPLLDYFDSTYVSGSLRSSQVRATGSQGTVLRLRRQPPTFPPSTWNVHEATMTGQARTNNVCESWNNGYRVTVGHAHPDIYVSIEAIRKDAAMSSTVLHKLDVGQPPKKRIRKETRDLQARLKSLCTEYREGSRRLISFLRAVGHNIHLR